MKGRSEDPVAQRHARIRLVKRLLKRLPRRATVHRYPVLKWFAEAARRRSYLWSFRKAEVIPAIYAGCILALMPLYGFQILLAFFASVAFRANLMVMVALQFISNPLTLVIIYPLAYKTGDVVLNWFNFDAQSVAKDYADVYDAHPEVGAPTEDRLRVFYWFFAASIGGMVLGYVLAFILSMAYQVVLWRAMLRIKPAAGERQGLAVVTVDKSPEVDRNHDNGS